MEKSARNCLAALALVGIGTCIQPCDAAATVASKDQPKRATPVPFVSSARSIGQLSVAVAVDVAEQRLVEGPFWVDAVDRVARSIVVHNPDGAQMTVDVAPNAIGFNDLKRGDRVDLEYVHSSVVALRPSRGTAIEMMEAPANPAAAPTPARRVAASVRLTAVDSQRGTIRFTDDKGRTQIMQVRDPALSRTLQNLKPGDRVDVTYTTPVATSIRKSVK